MRFTTQLQPRPHGASGPNSDWCVCASCRHWDAALRARADATVKYALGVFWLAIGVPAPVQQDDLTEAASLAVLERLEEIAGVK